MLRTSTMPPNTHGATLSRWRPATTDSAARAASSTAISSSGSSSSAFAAAAPATALAAEPPWPPRAAAPSRARARCRTSGCPAPRARSSSARAAMADAWASGSDGRSGCPAATTRTPAPSSRHAVTRSAGPVTAHPRMSRPGPRLPMPPGAVARAATPGRQATSVPVWPRRPRGSSCDELSARVRRCIAGARPRRGPSPPRTVYVSRAAEHATLHPDRHARRHHRLPDRRRRHAGRHRHARPGRDRARRGGRDDVHAGRHRDEHDARPQRAEQRPARQDRERRQARALGRLVLRHDVLQPGRPRGRTSRSRRRIPGKIQPLDLTEWGGTVLAQKDAFLCAARGIEVSVAFNRRIGAGFFGGEGFILQRSTATGWRSCMRSGTLIEHRARAPASRCGSTPGASWPWSRRWTTTSRWCRASRRSCSAARGSSSRSLTGPGRVILQTMPFSRLADRIIAASPSAGGKRVGEGSVLGGLGGLLDGDN